MAMAEKSNNERGICQWLLVSFFSVEVDYTNVT